MKRFTPSIKKNVEELFGDPDAFEKLYIGKKGSCIPEDLIREDLLLDIKEKFYCILHPIRERLEKEKVAKKPVYIYVDPSYEAHTIAVLAYDNKDILFTIYEKPWRLYWETTRDMEEELNKIYEVIKGKLLEKR